MSRPSRRAASAPITAPEIPPYIQLVEDKRTAAITLWELWCDARCTKNDRIVAVTLGSHMTSEGFTIVKVSVLAARSFLHQRTVERSLSHLKEIGWLDITHRTVDGRKRASLYRFRHPTGKSLPRIEAPQLSLGAMMSVMRSSRSPKKPVTVDPTPTPGRPDRNAESSPGPGVGSVVTTASPSYEEGTGAKGNRDPQPLGGQLDALIGPGTDWAKMRESLRLAAGRSPRPDPGAR